MSWELLTELEFTDSDWHFSPITNADLFRFHYAPLAGALRLYIAQAQTLAGIEIFDLRRLYPKPEIEIIEYPKPEFFSDRCLALRAYANSYPWTLQIEAWSMPLSRSISLQPVTSATATSSAVNASTTSVSLLAANTSRKGATIWNASTAILYLDLDAASSNSAYAVQIGAGDYYEVPFGFTGEISGVWAAANGNAQIREFT
jgi:hypothetical protein